jgi:hypothetical protein
MEINFGAPHMKQFAVLQITPQNPNPEHIEMFSNKSECDFFFVTHDSPHPDGLKYCPNTSWAETRNILVEKVPKNYEYLLFVDYDYKIESLTSLGIVQQICKDLEVFEPSFYSAFIGDGIPSQLRSNTLRVRNTSFLNSRAYSINAFISCGMKAIHHTLVPWFFPMFTRFDGGYSAAHLFNILEIPFYETMITSHNIIYHNMESPSETRHNANPNRFENMNTGWCEIRETLNFEYLSSLDEKFNPPFPARNLQIEGNSLKIKEYFERYCIEMDFEPRKSKRNINHYSEELISKYFNLNHPFFKSRI